MGLVSVRPAFRHVRVCVACDGRIDEKGACSCSGPSPFQRGASVTICSDEAGEIPLRIHTIARIGNGGFRLADSAAWYGFDGMPQSGAGVAGTSCRAVREGDAAAITARTAHETRAKRIADEEQQIEYDERRIVEAKASVSGHRYEGGRFESWARMIDPKAEGEGARITAERAATERMYDRLFVAAESRARVKIEEGYVALYTESIKRRRARIAMIKAET